MRHSSTEICRICWMIDIVFICRASVPAGQLPGDVKVTVTWFPWQQLQSGIFVAWKGGMTYNHVLILRTTKSLKLGNFYIVSIIVSIPEMYLFMCIFCFVCCVSQILLKRKAIEDFPKSKHVVVVKVLRNAHVHRWEGPRSRDLWVSGRTPVVLGKGCSYTSTPNGWSPDVPNRDDVGWSWLYIPYILYYYNVLPLLREQHCLCK